MFQNIYTVYRIYDMYEVTSSNLMIRHLVLPHLIWLKSTNKKRPNVGLVEGNREKGENSSVQHEIEFEVP